MGDSDRNLVLIGFLIPLFFATLFLGKNLVFVIGSCVLYISVSSILATYLFKDINLFEAWDIKPNGSLGIYYLSLFTGITLLFIIVNIPELFDFGVVYIITVLFGIGAGRRVIPFTDFGYRELKSMLIPALSFPFIVINYTIFNGVIGKFAQGGIPKEVFAIVLILVGVIAPICEEILFRSVIMYALKQHAIFVSAFLNALLFSIFHTLVYGNNLYGLVYVFCLGYGISLTVCLTKNLTPAILIHILNNSLAVLLIVFLL